MEINDDFLVQCKFVDLNFKYFDECKSVEGVDSNICSIPPITVTDIIDRLGIGLL